MKIAFVNDLHLNDRTYKGVMDRERPDLPFRNADFMRAFEYICTECINKIKPDLMIIGGDVYDYYEVTNEVEGFFSAQMARLVEANIPIIILLGNHDVCKKHHALKGLHELRLKKIKVIENPAVIKFKDINLLLFPYSLTIERQEVTTKQEFETFLETIGEKKLTGSSIFIGHLGVRGAKLSTYDLKTALYSKDPEVVTDTTTTMRPIVTKEQKAFINNNPNDVSVEDLDQIGAKHVVLGDYHQHQILATENCYSMYTGSIERTDFSEVDQDKGFIVYDSEEKEIEGMGRCRFIKYPNCRPMLELKGNIFSMQEQFSAINTADYQDAVVKLHFEGTSEELVDFSSHLEKFKKQIRHELKPIHLVSEQKVRDEEMEEEASELQQRILEQGHMSDDDILDMAKEMINERIKDAQSAKAVIELAEDIHQEAMGS